MLEVLVFAASGLAVFGGGYLAVWLHRRRVEAELDQPPAVSFPDRIVASSWRISPTAWLLLDDDTKKQLRESVTSAPGPRRH